MNGAPGVQILEGDCREVLRGLPGESVDCVVTSPPYWGLRDYGTGTWEGGDANCAHAPTQGIQGETGDRADRTFTGARPQKAVCSRCGAVRVDSQIGLEPAYGDFVEAMVEVFREVKRVLKPEGSLWLNLGDSYASQGGHSDTACNDRRGEYNLGNRPEHDFREFRVRGAGQLKPKDLCGMPWRVALALQADGWFLRSDIIWHKPNPMPESVSDRPTKAHEYLFLLTKSERYFYDAEAIAEPVSASMMEQVLAGYEGESLPGFAEAGAQDPSGTKRRIIENARKKLTAGKWSGEEEESSGFRMVEAVANARANGAAHDAPFGLTRNKRSVWTVPTFSYREAHFATFPPDLIRPCILAGCPAGGVVLDPFGGSGTTGAVALELGRSAILIELNPKYAEMARGRCAVTPGLGI